MADRRRITRADILTLDDYAAQRAAHRARIREIKNRRRAAVGPFATFHFENFDTMWYQIHEMLFIEKGGEAQIADELAAYASLVPNGRELIATLMFEIEDPARRDRELAHLGGVESTVFLSVGEAGIAAQPTDDLARSKPGGRTASVHFLRFPFTPAQIAAFRDRSRPARIGIDHPAYNHVAGLSEILREALIGDFGSD